MKHVLRASSSSEAADAPAISRWHVRLYAALRWLYVAIEWRAAACHASGAWNQLSHAASLP